MKKILSIIIAVAILALGTIPSFAFTVDPKFSVQHNGSTSNYDSLTKAVNAAKNGDVVVIASEVMNLTTSESVTITKNITVKTGNYFNGYKKYIQYNGTSAPLFTVANGATLTLANADIFGNTNSSLNAGGLVRVKNGGKLIIDGKAGAEVIIKNFKLNAKDSKGGAVYCEQGGTVIVNGVTFSDNSASLGRDIFAESENDVTIKSGVSADFAFNEEVETNKCPYCGKVHPNNFWGNFVSFFHVIFNFFRSIFS